MRRMFDQRHDFIVDATERVHIIDRVDQSNIVFSKRKSVCFPPLRVFVSPCGVAEEQEFIRSNQRFFHPETERNVSDTENDQFRSFIRTSLRCL